jgi:hypothetical protein
MAQSIDGISEFDSIQSSPSGDLSQEPIVHTREHTLAPVASASAAYPSSGTRLLLRGRTAPPAKQTQAEEHSAEDDRGKLGRVAHVLSADVALLHRGGQKSSAMNSRSDGRGALDPVSGLEDAIDTVCPFIFLAIQGIVLLAVLMCALAAYIGDCSENDVLELPWYCVPCGGASQCCIGMLSTPPMLLGFMVYLIAMNFIWMYLCERGVVQQYLEVATLYLFLLFLILGAVVALLCCARTAMIQTVWQYSAVKRCVQMERNVAAVTTWFESQYGRKFFQVMKGSGEFSMDALADMKAKMQGSGMWSIDKLDDASDWLGLTECSSSDDETYMDTLGRLKHQLLHGQIHSDEYSALRRDAHDKKVKTSMNKHTGWRKKSSFGNSKKNINKKASRFKAACC